MEECDRDRALKEWRKRTPRKEYTVMRRVIMLKPFIRNLQLLLAIVANINNSDSKTPRVRYSRQSRTLTTSLPGDRGERDQEPATARDHEACRPGSLKFRAQGCVPTGRWCYSVTTPFPPTGLRFISFFRFLLFVVLFRIPARLGLFQCCDAAFSNSPN